MLPLVLKIISPIFVMVELLHLVMGLQADVLLGAKISAETMADPVLDSQSRFYGVAFSVYGLLFYVCAGNLERYQMVFRILLGVFFAAGCARLVSIAVHSLPTVPVLLLLGTELGLPPLLYWWQTTTVVRNRQDRRPT